MYLMTLSKTKDSHPSLFNETTSLSRLPIPMNHYINKTKPVLIYWTQYTNNLYTEQLLLKGG